MDQKTRPTYYDGQYLGADDLDALVRYARTAQAQHALGGHLWGIAIGLELAERSLGGDDVEMVLTPGVAWDGYGRGLIAPAPQRVGLDQFANFPDTDAEGIPVFVWLTYRELPSNPPGPGFSCPDDNLYGAVVESFRIELRLAESTDTHTVSLANRSVDATKALSTFDAAQPPLFDESVPHQAFPDSGNNPRWPIFAGILRWRKFAGATGTLIKRTDLDLNKVRKLRRYIGAVAEAIVAADGVIRLRDRSNNPADPSVNYQAPTVAPAGAVNDLVWCEGNLRVVGDARLQPQGDSDGKLEYRIKGGTDDGVPVYLRRTLVKTPVRKTTLDAYLAPPAARPPDDAQTRFTVSTTDDKSKPKECLTVVANSRVGGVVTTARVGVNQPDPTAQLHVHSDDANQGNIQLFSASADFEYDGGGDKRFIFKDTGGLTAFLGGKIGIGTDAPAAKVEVDNPVQGHIQLFSATADFEYDGGDDQLFVFKDTGGKTAFLGGKIGIGTAAPDSAFQVHSTNPAQGDVRMFSGTADFEYDGGNDGLFIFKDTGGTTAFMGGDIGIGTSTPATKLNVVGNRIRLGDNNKRIDLRTDGAAVDLHSETDHLYIRSTGPGGKNNVIINALAGDGFVGIGIDVPTAKLHVHGDIQLDFGVFFPSDRRLKESITSIERPLERLLALQGVEFKWRAAADQAENVEAGPQHGFIAQDVESVFPEWVKQAPDGTKLVNVTGFNAVFVEAVRELTARCNRLESELAELRARVDGRGSPEKPSTKKPGRRPNQKKNVG